jgi:hypothetical protein
MFWLNTNLNKIIMKKLAYSLMSVMMVAWLSGCTYTGAVRSNITPISTVGKVYNNDVVLIIDPSINTAEVNASVGVHKVKVAAGSALNSAILEAARLVFPKVSPQVAASNMRGGDLVIQTRLMNISGNASINQGFWSNSASVTTQVSIVIEMLHKDGSLIYRQVVTGTGLENQSDALAQNVAKSMEIALERSVQQVSDQATTVFVTGLAQMK